MKARIIPGAVGTTSLRGIVLADIDVQDFSVDTPAQVRITAVSGSPKFLKQMDAHDARLHHFVIDQLRPGTDHVHDGNSNIRESSRVNGPGAASVFRGAHLERGERTWG